MRDSAKDIANTEAQFRGGLEDGVGPSPDHHTRYAGGRAGGQAGRLGKDLDQQAAAARGRP
jgi:hypothetical protein